MTACVGAGESVFLRFSSEHEKLKIYLYLCKNPAYDLAQNLENKKFISRKHINQSISNSFLSF